MANALIGLRGRRRECVVLRRLVAAARAGQSGVLVVRGEAGVGKTALLDYLAQQADGCRVARAAGVGSEMELAYAGLHQLCSHFLDSLGTLPEPQRDALITAFGLSAGEPPDRFMVALAVLSLLSEAAEERPLVCIVDDAQWLDRVSAQTLAFVGRRLLAEPIVMVFAIRGTRDDREFVGLPELALSGLNHRDARMLLDSVLPGPVDEQVRDRLVIETRGNPLALLELPRGLTPTELAFGFSVGERMPLASRIEEGFLRRLEQVPPGTRRFLLAAAAEPSADDALLRRAADRLGIGPEAAAAAEATGLIELTPLIRFRHPLVRSAAYRSASSRDRQEVHRALAEVTDPETDPDRRAWHRARAAVEPDGTVADELERSADRAQARGGLAAAAAFLEEATRLSLDPEQRAARALAAAHARHDAGASDAALSLLASAQAGPFDELRQARIDLLHAQIVFAGTQGDEAPPLLLEAGRRLEPLDLRLARETYLEAFTAAVMVGRLSRGAGLLEVAKVVRAAPGPPSPPRPPDLLLDGLALLVTEGRAAAAPLLKEAVSAFRGDDLSPRERLRWLWLVGRVAQDLWDDESWEVLCTEHVRLARRTGALAVLPTVLRSRIFQHGMWGELDQGAVLTREVEAVSAATGIQLAAYGTVALSALRGREADARKLLDATLEDVLSRGEGMGVSISHYAAALLYNGLGQHTKALAEAELASEYEDLGVISWALTELIEAAARCERPDKGAAALNRLSEIVHAGGTDWALGIEARSRALMTHADSAESFYREAIQRLRRTRVRVELARAHLVYGEWLRRERRPMDARDQLRTAHQMFEEMGVEAFAERARRELLATGGTARTRVIETRDELTPQEAQIARMASDGLSNPEIGAELFISARTVKYHLRKVFTKLGITSRHELREALSTQVHTGAQSQDHRRADRRAVLERTAAPASDSAAIGGGVIPTWPTLQSGDDWRDADSGAHRG
jgi:DNA-binding CsgD family transcriptional regulator